MFGNGAVKGLSLQLSHLFDQIGQRLLRSIGLSDLGHGWDDLVLYFALLLLLFCRLWVWWLGYRVDCFDHEFFEVIEKHLQLPVLKDRAVVVAIIWMYFSQITNLTLIDLIDSHFAKIEPSSNPPTHHQIPLILDAP